MQNMEFGQRLYVLIKQRGLNQRSFAAGVGIASSAVTAYVKRGRIPESTILQRTATYLNTSMEYLLTGKGPSQLPAEPPKQETHADQIVEMKKVVDPAAVTGIIQNPPQAQWFTERWSDARWKAAHLYVDTIFYLGEEAVITSTLELLQSVSRAANTINNSLLARRGSDRPGTPQEKDGTNG